MKTLILSKSAFLSPEEKAKLIKLDGFLGIATGKKAKAKAQAKIDIINAQAAADAAKAKIEADSLALKLSQAQAGYTPEKDAQEAAIKTQEIQATASNTIYYVLAGVVVVVMIGLYLLRKR